MAPIYRNPPYRFESDVLTRSALGQRIDWGLHAQGIPEVWQATSGEGVLVGVIDTDGRADHPDLPRPEFTYNYSRSRTAKDRSGHGTHVAGIIAARSNSIGVVGVAPKCSIGVIKALGDGGGGYVDDLARAIDRCVSEGCSVINCSWGGGHSPTIEQAVTEAAAKGVLVVAAAGNSGGVGVDWPGRLPDTVAVASYRKDGSISDFSSRGPEVDLACPGEAITSCWPGGSYQSISGTSMAAPFAAGIAALYLSSGGKPRSAQQIREHLGRITTDHGPDGHDHASGWGLLDIGKILTPIPQTTTLGPYTMVLDGRKLVVDCTGEGE